MVYTDAEKEQATSKSLFYLQTADRNAASYEEKTLDFMRAKVWAEIACPCCCDDCFDNLDRWVPHYRQGTIGVQNTSILAIESQNTHNGAFTLKWTWLSSIDSTNAGLAFFYCNRFVLDGFYELRFWTKGYVHSANPNGPSPGSEPAAGSYVTPLIEVSSEVNETLPRSTVPWVDGDTIRTGGPGNWTWTVSNWREIVLQFHITNESFTQPYEGSPYGDLEGVDVFSSAPHIQLAWLFGSQWDHDAEWLLSDFSLTRLE